MQYIISLNWPIFTSCLRKRKLLLIIDRYFIERLLRNRKVLLLKYNCNKQTNFTGQSLAQYDSTNCDCFCFNTTLTAGLTANSTTAPIIYS